MTEKEDLTELLKKKIKESIDSKGNHLNPMRVGRVTSKKQFSFAFQPHNHRRYYSYDTTTLSEQTLLKNIGKEGIVGFEFSKKNYGTELHLNNFWGCRVVIRKKTIEVINKWQGKRWRVIEGDTIEEIDSKIDAYIEELNTKSDEAIKKVIKYGHGKPDMALIKTRGEIGIHGDEFLDSIPEDLIIQDTYFKKLYKKKPEFNLDNKGKAGYVKNYISIRAIEKVSPEIANEIKGVNDVLQGELKPVLESLTEQIKLHLEVQKITKDTMKDIRDFIVKKPIPRRNKISPNVASFITKLEKGEVNI